MDNLSDSSKVKVIRTVEPSGIFNAGRDGVVLSVESDFLADILFFLAADLAFPEVLELFLTRLDICGTD